MVEPEAVIVTLLEPEKDGEEEAVAVCDTVTEAVADLEPLDVPDSALLTETAALDEVVADPQLECDSVADAVTETHPEALLEAL